MRNYNEILNEIRDLGSEEQINRLINIIENTDDKNLRYLCIKELEAIDSKSEKLSEKSFEKLKEWSITELDMGIISKIANF